jgi:hypothetical protein
VINLLQISDLHINENIDNASNALLSGYSGHDVELCRALARLLGEDIRDIENVSEDEDITVIVNGDLTASGTSNEFGVVNTFLYSSHALVTGQHVQKIGLNLDQGASHTVPGNHDHWGGVSPTQIQRGFTREIYDRFLGPPPYVSPPICGGGIELRLFGIDSCTMFEDRFFNRNLLAGGGFSDRHKRDFQRIVASTLKEPLAEDCEMRVAIIICHHPFSKDGSAGPLRNRCASWLAKLAAKYGIRMIFTGHTHNSWTNLLKLTDCDDKTVLREVRCPTTLQYPAKLDEKKRKPGAWLHQVYADGDAVIWRGTLLLYSSGSFQIPVTLQEGGKIVTERVGWFEERITPLLGRN